MTVKRCVCVACALIGESLRYQPCQCGCAAYYEREFDEKDEGFSLLLRASLERQREIDESQRIVAGRLTKAEEEIVKEWRWMEAADRDMIPGTWRFRPGHEPKPEPPRQERAAPPAPARPKVNEEVEAERRRARRNLLARQNRRRLREDGILPTSRTIGAFHYWDLIHRWGMSGCYRRAKAPTLAALDRGAEAYGDCWVLMH